MHTELNPVLGRTGVQPGSCAGFEWAAGGLLGHTWPGSVRGPHPRAPSEGPGAVSAAENAGRGPPRDPGTGGAAGRQLTHGRSRHTASGLEVGDPRAPPSRLGCSVPSWPASLWHCRAWGRGQRRRCLICLPDSQHRAGSLCWHPCVYHRRRSRGMTPCGGRERNFLGWVQH